MKVLNAFSVSMLPSQGGKVEFKRLSLKQAQALINSDESIFLISAIGHAATAEVFSAQLGVNIPVNRVTISLAPGKTALLGSLNVRLPEGTVLSTQEMTTFPITWYSVKVQELERG